MDNPKILCVDDEKAILSALRRTLRNSNYELLLAGSVPDALSVMETTKVDLVISDMRMPEINGAQFLKEVTVRWPETVQILLTGYSELDAVEQVKQEANLFCQLPKPWDNDELLAAVKRGLGEE